MGCPYSKRHKMEERVVISFNPMSHGPMSVVHETVIDAIEEPNQCSSATDQDGTCTPSSISDIKGTYKVLEAQEADAESHLLVINRFLSFREKRKQSLLRMIDTPCAVLTTEMDATNTVTL